MKRSRLAWTAWAILPALALSYHFGPGQRHHNEAHASRLLIEANTQQSLADEAQDAAYEAHRAAVAARLAARARPDDPLLARAAHDLTTLETEAYASAADAWTRAAETYGGVLASLTDSAPEVRDPVRLARARALVRSGDLDSGVSELESILDSVDPGSEIALEAREEYATAHYFGARALRVQGAPTEEWRQVAAIARENYRYVAERAALNATNAHHVSDMQRNGELVLNLEQSALEEILAKPRPRGSPGDGVCKAGTLPGKGRGKGRGNRGEQPSNGAGHLGEIGDGW